MFGTAMREWEEEGDARCYAAQLSLPAARSASGDRPNEGDKGAAPPRAGERTTGRCARTGPSSRRSDSSEKRLENTLIVRASIATRDVALRGVAARATRLLRMVVEVVAIELFARIEVRSTLTAVELMCMLSHDLLPFPKELGGSASG